MMRIISQNGEHDLPYDRTYVRRTEKNIFAYHGADLRLMAMYDTEEEAENALRQMWIQYKRLDGKAGTFRFPPMGQGVRK